MLPRSIAKRQDDGNLRGRRASFNLLWAVHIQSAADSDTVCTNELRKAPRSGIPEPSKQAERRSFEFGDPSQPLPVNDDIPAPSVAANRPPSPPEPRQTETPPEQTERWQEVNAYATTLTAAPAIAPYPTALPLTRSYPVLEITALVCRWLGYIVLVLAAAFILLSFLLAVLSGLRTDVGLLPSLGFGLFGSIPTSLGALFAAAILIMNAEMIQLGIHVQANTLATAHAVRH